MTHDQDHRGGAHANARKLSAPPMSGGRETETELDDRARRALARRYQSLVRDRLEEKELVVDRGTSSALRMMSGDLGLRCATPRDVVAIHVLALSDWVESTSSRRSRAIVATGGSVLIEVLGHLAAYYRDLALAEPAHWRSESIG